MFIDQSIGQKNNNKKKQTKTTTKYWPGDGDRWKVKGSAVVTFHPEAEMNVVASKKIWIE